MEKIIILTLLIFSFQSFAFRLNTSTGAAFKDNEVKIYVTSNSTCTQAGTTPEELLDLAVEASDDFWNTVSTANITVKKGGIKTITDTNYITGELCVSDSDTSCPGTSVPKVNDIVIACNNNATNFTSSSLLALSGPNNVSGSTISGSVILINDLHTSFSLLSRSEKLNVLAHEIGHALGLGHTNKSEALMYYKNSDDRVALSQDDIDGITYLYPYGAEDLFSCEGMFAGTIKNKLDPPNGPFALSTNSMISFILSLFMGLTIGFYLLKLPKFFTSKAVKYLQKS